MINHSAVVTGLESHAFHFADKDLFSQDLLIKCVREVMQLTKIHSHTFIKGRKDNL